MYHVVFFVFFYFTVNKHCFPDNFICLILDGDMQTVVIIAGKSMKNVKR